MPSYGRESQRGNSLRPHPSAEDLPIPTLSARFPAYKRELPSEIPPYWDVYHNLSCIGEALVYGSWIMAPNSLCSEVLNTLHSAHQGITSLKAHTQTSVYWHGMSTGIINCCQQCSLCGAIISILPASITRLPTTNTRILVVDDYIHLAGQHFLVWYESLQEWLGTFGDHKEISNDGGKPLASTLLHSLPPDNLSVAEIGLDCIYLTTTHVLKDILAVFHK